MAQKNIYYRDVIQRRNKIKFWFFTLVGDTASLFRLFIEVFIRRNFGHRYFNFGVAVFVCLVLLLTPVVIDGLKGNNTDLWAVIKADPLWYLFCAVFLYFCWLRHRESAVKPGAFDFSKFSLSMGERHPLFLDLRVNGKPFTPRQIEIFLEPLPFFIGGVILLSYG